MCADNDNNAEKWTDDDRAKASAAHASYRAGLAATRKAEAKACRRAGAPARHRQILGDGWDGKADNDNIGWPLAKALKADGKEHLLRAAMEYRRIEASANSGSQLGGTALGLEPVRLDQKTWVNREGEVVTKGERKLTSAAYADVAPTQAGRQTEGMMRPAQPAPKPWNGDAKVNAMIDDKDRLARLRGVLGPMVDAFEDAVLSGRTLEDIGRGVGRASSKSSAAPAGKAIVIMALYVVASELQRIRMDEAAPSLRAA
ncbi:MAG: hypothetical protein OJJ21_16810 [Ferrovibrio sp.]|uniref:hypothetical protein n=1 Tax=Ferrovibrio sp. TaxID=1917215 RepID=UPI0026211CE8|nr:hypothetical protein [Ferrovibrio sp.]MCW0235264.1 hypothetical protein [Ferrovibrio sp.]